MYLLTFKLNKHWLWTLNLIQYFNQTLLDWNYRIVMKIYQYNMYIQRSNICMTEFTTSLRVKPHWKIEQKRLDSRLMCKYDWRGLSCISFQKAPSVAEREQTSVCWLHCHHLSPPKYLCDATANFTSFVLLTLLAVSGGRRTVAHMHYIHSPSGSEHSKRDKIANASYRRRVRTAV